MSRLLLSLSTAALFFGGAIPAAWAQVRIVTYNCADPTRADVPTLLDALGDQNRSGFSRPLDILLLQEQESVSMQTKGFADDLNALYGGGYSRGFSNGATTGGGRPGVVYNTNVLQLVEEVAVNAASSTGAPRATMRYKFRPVGYDAAADFYVYNSHLKASSGGSNETRRALEVSQIRSNSDALGQGAHVIYAGDMNIYKASEDAFVNFTNAGAGQAFDPVNRIGAWDNSSAFRDVHTQSPVTNSQYGGQVTGGLNSRFDFQLVTAEVLDGRGFAYITNSYWAFGNTATHTLGGALSSGSVDALQSYLPGYSSNQASAVIAAIMSSSDHLPVVADYQLPARMGVNTFALAPRAILGAVITNSLLVSNNAPVAVTAGADRLEYSFTGTGGVSASGGGTNWALTAANQHNFTFAASTVGTSTGSLSVNALSPQTANASFLTNFSVDVLHHAAPSFASNSTVTSKQLDFGTQDFGASSAPLSFTLHNLAGLSGAAWTARLDLLSVVETSDPESVFSTPLSAFANLNAGSSVSSSIALATATRIGDFTGSYTLSFSDENLPGATALGSLVLQVSGSVSGAFNIAAGTTRTIADAVGGNGAVTKSGSGTLVFAANNTYTGATAVNAGRLVANGTNTASAVTVNSGGSFSGTGRVGSLSLGGTVAPGNAVGTLGAGNTVLSGGGAFELEMFDWNGTAGTGWDLLAVDGSLSLSNTAGSPFTINLVSMSSTNSTGLSIGWNASQSFTNTFLSYSGSLSGSFDTSAFLLNTNGFQNAANGTFSVVSVAGGLALRYTAFSGAFVWNATSGLLSSGGGWLNSSVPTNGASISFAGASGGTITNDSLSSVAGIVFTNGAGNFRIAGNSFTVGAGGITNLSAAGQTISNNLSLGAPSAFSSTAGDLTMAGAIDNGGHLLTVAGAANTFLGGVISNAGGLAKIGSGSLTLAGNNTFGGALTVSGGTVLLQGSQAANAVEVGAGVLTLGASERIADAATLSLSNGGTIDLGTFSETIGVYSQNAGIITNGTLNAASYHLGGGTVGATLGTGGAANVTGAVTLSGLVNGTLNVNSGGTLTLASANRIADNSAVTVNGGTLAVGEFDETLGSVVVTNGGTLSGTGTMTASSYTLHGGTAGANLGSGSASVVGGINVLSGNLAGSLVASGGTLALNGSVAGSVTVSGGTVNLGSSNRIADSSAVNVSSGALNLAGDDSVGSVQMSGGSIGGTGSLNAASYQVQSGTISAALGGSASFVKAGTGTATLSGNNSNYNGTIDVQSGILVAGHGNALGGSSLLLTNGGIRAATGVSLANNFTIGALGNSITNFTTNSFLAYWNFGTNAGNAAVTSVTGTGLIFGSVTNGNSLAAVLLTNNAASMTNNYAGASGQFNAGANARGGVFSNGSTHFSFNVTPSDGYTFSLTNVSFGSRSTGTGPTSLALHSSLDNFASALSSTAVSTNSAWALVAPSVAATVLTNGAVTYRVYGFGGAGGSSSANWRIDDLTLRGISVMGSVSNVSALGSGSLGIHGSGAAFFTGSITNHASATLIAGDGGSVTFSGPISGGGSLTKTGSGTVILGAANAFAGGFFVESGVLRVQNAGGFGSGFVTQASGSSTIVFDAPGTVTNAMSIYKVRAMQNVTLSGAKTLNNATYIVDPNVTMTESGFLTGPGGVTKQGSGTLVLTAANSFAGPTVVEEGTLSLDSPTGSPLGGTPSVSVASGATLLLARSGQVNDSASVSLSGGTIQRASGVSEVFGSLNITSPSFLDFGGGAAGNITFGSLAYTPSALTALRLVNFTQGNSLTIQTATDLTDSIGTAFTSSGAGGIGGFSFNGTTFTITAIPEPSTYLAAAGLLGLMLWPSRKRIIRGTKKILGFKAPMRDRLARRAS